jgi:cell fate (sporulation/competence/biofilm development) regulator YlbF (YheA/YmcA/DUF963 family)
MDRQAIVEKAWDTVDEIKAGALYQEYSQAVGTLTQDPLLKPLVDEFTAAKAAFEPLKAFGSHHPEWKAASQRLAKAKDALFLRPEYQSYLEKFHRLEAFLAQIGSDLQAVLDECTLAKKPHCQDR